MRVGFVLGTVAVVIGISTLGCAEGNKSPSERTTTSRHAIIAGKTSPASQDYVVALAIRPKGTLEGMCSGTLVAPNVVLTALHCVSDTTGPLGCDGGGNPVDGFTRGDYLAEELFIYKGASAVTDIRADREVVTRAAAHGSRVLTESSTAFCNSDVAFIILDKELKGPYAPIRLKKAPAKSEKLFGVGFGIDESGVTAATRMERTGLEVIDVGPALLSADIDYGIGTSEFVTGESACNGDSGGPVVANDTGAVIGVTSRVGGGDGNNGQLDPENAAAGCAGAGTRAIYTSLFEKKLVEQAFTSAGKPMWLEGEKNPFLLAPGAACSEGLECSSTVCDAKVCAKRCDDGTACGADETCAPRDGTKICIKSAQPPAQPNVPSSNTTGGDVTPEPPGATTDTKLVFGCSSSPSGARARGGFVFAALAALALVTARRRKR